MRKDEILERDLMEEGYYVVRQRLNRKFRVRFVVKESRQKGWRTNPEGH